MTGRTRSSREQNRQGEVTFRSPRQMKEKIEEKVEVKKKKDRGEAEVGKCVTEITIKIGDKKRYF